MSEESLPSGDQNQKESTNKKEVDKTDIPVVIPDELQPLLEDMPEAQAKAVKAIFVGMSIQKHTFRSPIPPPSILKGYNEVIPNGADRILTMTEKQAEHRMSMEKTVVAREQNQSGRGQNYGFIVAMAFLVAAFILILLGHEISGTVIGSIDIVALVSVFVVGKYLQRKELRGK